MSPILNYADMKIVPNSKCIMEYGAAHVKESTLCVVGLKNKDDNICKGDSGGPLVLKLNDGSFIQVGIVSFFVGGCMPGLPSAFTRVNSYLHWIYEVVGYKL